MIGKAWVTRVRGQRMQSREGSHWFQLAAATVGKQRTDVHRMVEFMITIGNLMEYCRADHRNNYLL